MSYGYRVGIVYRTKFNSVNFKFFRLLSGNNFQCTISDMQFIASILPYIQVALAIFLIAAILLQSRGSSLGGAFGGDNSGSTFYTRRGAEKTLFQATIVLGILFAGTAFLTLFI